jgi:uncharacterized protein YjbI with pentapeptide repeats
MAGDRATARICRELSSLYRETGFKLEWAEAWTREHGHKVSRDTFSRAIRHRIGRMRDDTAQQIAEFIECETDGAITVGQLIQCHPGGGAMRKADLRGARFSGEDWSRRDLSGADLREAVLEGMNLDGAELARAKLQRATLASCSFQRTSLIHARLLGATLTGCDFTDADLEVSDWRHATVEQSTFARAIHTGTKMAHTRFRDCRWLTDRYGGGMSLKEANLRGLSAASESHGVLAEVFRRHAGGRRKMEMLAGWTDYRFMGCYQGFLDLMSQRVFNKPEREEVYGLLRDCDDPHVPFRLEYELQLRELLRQHYGADYPDWPHGRDSENYWRKALVGRQIRVLGIDGHIGHRSRFVPDSFEGDESDTHNADETMALIFVPQRYRELQETPGR